MSVVPERGYGNILKVLHEEGLGLDHVELFRVMAFSFIRSYLHARLSPMKRVIPSSYRRSRFSAYKLLYFPLSYIKMVSPLTIFEIHIRRLCYIRRLTISSFGTSKEFNMT